MIKRCKYCQKQFIAVRKTRLYCNRKCRANFCYHGKSIDYNRICKGCGNNFLATHSSKVYCHPKCNRRERERNMEYKKLYGITLEQYNKMLFNQNYSCAICNGKDSIGIALAVDHCHKTGKVRGLLCSGCNLMLGRLDDDINKLNNAIKYLECKNDIKQ